VGFKAPIIKAGAAEKQKELGEIAVATDFPNRPTYTWERRTTAFPNRPTYTWERTTDLPRQPSEIPRQPSEIPRQPTYLPDASGFAGNCEGFLPFQDLPSNWCETIPDWAICGIANGKVDGKGYGCNFTPGYVGSCSDSCPSLRKAAPPCMDLKVGDSPWADSGGDDCKRYVSRNWCTKYGDGYEKDGLTANKACCGCGGGAKTCDDGIITTPCICDGEVRDNGQCAKAGSSYVPGKSKGPDKKACEDVKIKDLDWADSTDDNCARYVANEWCERYGDGYENDGYTANTACCGCGGGIRGGVPPATPLDGLVASAEAKKQKEVALGMKKKEAKKEKEVALAMKKNEQLRQANKALLEALEKLGP